MCEKYLLSYYKDDIISILKDPDANKHFSVNIEFVELVGTDTALGKCFLEEPEKALEEWNSALKKVQRDLVSNSENNLYQYKEHTRCRMYKFPLYPDFHRNKLPQNEDVGKFLEVSGTVVRVTAVKMFEYQRQYICSKCKYIMTVDAQYELKNIIVPPKKCENPDSCTSAVVISLGELNKEHCKDYQEIKIQETLGKLDIGCIPNSMWITLEDDLVDCCKPGDNITVCGFVKRRQNQFCIGRKMEIELVIKANHIRIDNADSSFMSADPKLKEMFEAFWKTYNDRPLVARDIILKSICPQLFGLYIVKLAVAVVLAGGSNIHNNSSTGVRVRTQPHLLLVGDPGTGKSQLLRFASKIIARSVLTTGVGSTAAGLTVAAVMENGEWQLEGGALVMSDGGICCIDEFNTMKEHDRISIHEAMEQQTISVAKAGIVCKLSTRCSVLAATNPKGNLDYSQPLNMNVALSSPLLSRFDLILLIRDRIDEEWDLLLTDYILSTEEGLDVNWSVETLRAYYAIITNIQPTLTEDSNKILSSYYQAQRRKNHRNKSRTTVRLLDSLVRLSQGHARLMAREQVQIMDAITAILLIEAGTEGGGSSIFNLRFEIRNDFPADPTENYRELMKIVLKKLDLNDLLEKELNPRKINNETEQEKNMTDAISDYRDDNQNKEENVAGRESELKKLNINDFQNVNRIVTCSSNITVLNENVELLKKCEIQNDPVAPNYKSSVNDIIYDSNEIRDENEEQKRNEENKRKTMENHDSNKTQEKPLSQRTRTKNRFQRFRFVPKDNTNVSNKNEIEVLASNRAETIDKIGNILTNDSIKNNSDDCQAEILVEQRVHSNSPLGQHTADNEGKLKKTEFDVSFENVHSSTQCKVPKSISKHSFSMFDNNDMNNFDFDI